MQKAQSRWDLVVINPSLVLGPGINPDGTSESFNIFRQLADGTTKFGAPAFNLGAVDVRDLAVATSTPDSCPKQADDTLSPPKL